MLTFDQYISALEKKTKYRIEDLKNQMAAGVPTDEYRQMVGRYRERKVAFDEIRATFTDLAKLEEGDMDDV